MNYNIYKNIPLYQRLWQNDIIPILEKADIVRDFPHNWLTPEVKNALESGDVEWVASSGTTSDRMQIMRPANWRQEELRKTFSQHPLLEKWQDENITRIALTTAVCSRTACFKEDPGPSKRRIGRTVYINLSTDPQTWSKQDLQRMLAEIEAHSSCFLDADPCYLALFLKAVKKYKLQKYLVNPLAITLGYELATAGIRHYISNTLDVPLINIYGSTEAGYLFMENASGALELCSRDTGIELLPLDPQINLYSLIITCTKNPYMPLIRYRSGDCVQTFEDNNPAILRRICGREKELFRTKDSLIPQAILDDQLFAQAPAIMLYQLQEQSQENCQLIYTTVDDLPLETDCASILQTQLSSLLCKPCTLQYRQSISPGLSGKFCWLKGEELL